MSILRLEAVKHKTGFRSHTSIYCAVREGTFTKQVRIGARAVGWPESEVQQLIAARIAGLTDEEIRKLVDKLHAQRALAPL